MNERLKSLILAFLFIVLLIIIAVIFLYWLEFKENELRTSACNGIGYHSYLTFNNMAYCSNNGIDLYSVNIEDVGSFFHWQYRATKINLYNYGNENNLIIKEDTKQTWQTQK